MHNLPSGWNEYGFNGPDSVTFLRPGHTVKEPRLAIFSRKAPAAQADGTFSVPTYRVRLIDGAVDSEDVPVKERAVLDLTIRCPLTADLTDFATAIGDLSTILANAEFVQDVTVDYMLPREYEGA